MASILADIPEWVRSILIVAVAVLVALMTHYVVMKVAARAARRTVTQTDDIIIRHMHRASRWLLVALALVIVQPALKLDGQELELWRRVAGLVIPGLIGWLAVKILSASTDIILFKADISVEDNLRARRRRTRASILHRILVATVILATFCLMLMSIPAVRTVGVTLIASAGLAALAIGAAAQPALKNLIAGLQMAFTEPIRLDDVVIIDNEWGRIEDIRLTFVVVRIWDDRRLVVPVSKFLEESFQNWTRETSQLLGAVVWYLDPAADIPRLREKLGEIIAANPRWDKRFFNMQVTDSKTDAIEVRALMTAKDASTAFDLRCDVREAVLAYIRTDMPEALPRHRGDLSLLQSPEGSLSTSKA
ncbi:mechanosensitive ion channel [Sphingomonas naphthae]|uniref:Mechanosensitive ion channel n=1 Tax=Sphingomonas naphthae TaxID=1813468 RepID=A0ABY7TNG2_9SPHN|nr:mechanosensitive ion channel domain-containing protein [Sphingomonas naphthae]WCT74261.1 mechanosensitive ion channel [Sphingomonas naphthae]